ncbi:hypothetical protein ACOMHN_008787 [Nucella lapillus]
MVSLLCHQIVFRYILLQWSVCCHELCQRRGLPAKRVLMAIKMSTSAPSGEPSLLQPSFIGADKLAGKRPVQTRQSGGNVTFIVGDVWHWIIWSCLGKTLVVFEKALEGVCSLALCPQRQFMP